MVTKEQLAGGLMVIKAVADAIKGAGQIPAGTLYAALNSKGCDLPTFERIVGMLTNDASGTPLVLRKNDLLIWNC